MTIETKVAPLKLKPTFPGLELCGAVLLAQMLQSSAETLNIQSTQLFAWCDSEITLAWDLYLSDTVSKVRQLIGREIWERVPLKTLRM